jgi:hypothetical protein
VSTYAGSARGAGLLRIVPVNAVATSPPSQHAGREREFVSVGEPTRLSESPLWDLQRRYFAARGVTAWSTGQVPHYVTSNPFIARGYARVAASFAADCRLAGLVGPGEAVDIIELGSGSGRFAHHFLIDFLAYMDRFGLGTRYIATDFVPANLDFLAAHPAFERWLGDGTLVLGRFDAPAGPLLGYPDEASPRAPAPAPLIVIANYVWCGLPQDCFVVANGELQEKRLELSLPPTVPEEEAHLALDHARMRWVTQPAARPYYADPELESLLDRLLSLPEGTEFLMPVVPIEAMVTLLGLSRGPVLVLSADRGTLREEQLVGARVGHHGCVSLDVNYSILGAWARARGARVMDTGAEPAALAVQAQLHGAASEAPGLTPLTFAESLDAGGPDDFFTVRGPLLGALVGATLAEQLAYLRLSVWDSRSFSELWPAISAATRSAPVPVAEDALRVADEVERRHLELPDDGAVVAALSEWRAQLTGIVARSGQRPGFSAHGG